MVFGRDFFWVVLQFGAWMRGPGFKIGLFGNCHAANGVSPEVFPDQFVWIAVGQECATTYGPINKLRCRRMFKPPSWFCLAIVLAFSRG